VVFDQPALTRQERVDALRRRNALAAFPDRQQAVLDGLLDKYVQAGIEHIEDIRILQLPPFSDQGSVVELIGRFGGREQYLQAVKQLQDGLYA
jgi:type I restriction enzyme R subunit